MTRDRTAPGRIDWETIRNAFDLAAVATALLGEPPGRRGERGRRLWWHCPFHDDTNPSFCVDPDKPWWKCYGCDAHGDAATLVMKLEGMSFPEAVAYLTGGPDPRGRDRPRPARKPTPRPKAPPAPSGIDPAAAAALVREAEARLWEPKGVESMAYLNGERLLAPETIRAASLGVVTCPQSCIPPGILIPWMAGNAPVLIKIRTFSGTPKYREVFRDPARLTCYPGPEAIRPGRPLIVTEGEFDCMLLAQTLGDRAAVITLGSASGRLDSVILGKMLTVSPWYIAHDRDRAGDQAAAAWNAYPRARRVRPPGPHKDWTDARAAGVDLRRFWGDILAGDPSPPLFTWNDLAGWRWGPARDDPAGGVVIDRPDPEGLGAVLDGPASDPETLAEREAMRAESET